MKMKTRRLMGLLAATMACGLTQISCSKGDTPVIVEEGYSISDEEFAGFNGKVIESGEMTTRAILEDMIEDHMDMQTYDDTIYTDYATSALEQLADANARTRAGEDGEPGSDKKFKLAYTTVRYTTTSVDASTDRKRKCRNSSCGPSIIYFPTRVRKTSSSAATAPSLATISDRRTSANSPTAPTWACSHSTPRRDC